MKSFAAPTKALVAMSLAIGMTGCSGLPGLLAGSNGLAGQQAIAAGSNLVNDGLAAVNSSEELDRGLIATQAAGYQTMSLDETAVASGSADSATASAAASGSASLMQSAALHGVSRDDDRMYHNAQSQLDGLRRMIDAKPPVVVTNADGTITTRFELTMTRRNSSMHEVIIKTTTADGKLISRIFDAERSNKSGHSIVIHRETRVNPDGSWTGSFKSTLTRKDGKVKITAWSTVGSADGSSKTTGTITRFDGSVVSISITYGADGSVAVVTRDDAAKVESDATKDELSTTADVTVKTGDKTLSTVKIIDTTEVEASDR